jgi:thiol-disulfide isomerase/thioredoxin
LAFFAEPDFYDKQKPVGNNVQLLDMEGLQKIISERNGKPLLINFWATWCVPCREEFSDLVKFYSDFKDKVDLIAISVDYPKESETKIKPFLDKMNPEFNTYVYSERDQESLINMISKDWSGALPATFVYDTGGKQVSFHDGKMSYEEFRNSVSKLINK